MYDMSQSACKNKPTHAGLHAGLHARVIQLFLFVVVDSFPSKVR